ncbi:MAG: L,D-transpeptidase [Ktedonobacteraceae bacterium]|nr:L,D-transpeptidase [Ktedonobacteraceae bacterium]
MQTHLKRISIFAPIIILIALCLTFGPSSAHSAEAAAGKLIVVSLSQGQLYAYQGGKQIFSTKVVTGRPDLTTPIGTFHVFRKLSNVTFYSPWRKGSPYWYAPSHVNHALEFLRRGYYLHDSWWRTAYGPGTNGWHDDPVYGWEWGTHGCVAMPDSAASWLYKWTPIGTMVQIKK